jgi:rSAM/selenodomain-associated transferase 1
MLTAGTGPALLVMAKKPGPGQTKSRLTPPLSAEAAAGLYACFLRDALDLAQSVPGVTPVIAYAPPEEESFFEEFAPKFPRIPQCGETLGERLNDVLTQCLQRGFAPVAAMNSDSPTLPAAYLALAFEKLAAADTDVVLGPCEDGGYYLIGWKRPHPRLVRNVQMSTERVLKDTLAIADAEDVHVTLLPAWYDIDDAGDFLRMQSDLASPSPFGRHTRAYLEQFPWPAIQKPNQGQKPG